MSRLGVVGAGAAGLGAAHELRDADVDVTLLEERETVCGRAATRTRNGCRYDHGANYLKPDDEGRTADLVERLDRGDVVDVTDPVYVFDGDGRIEPGDDDRADDHKWTWVGGIAQFGRRLLERTDAEVRFGTSVESLDRTDDVAGDEGWRAIDAAGDGHGSFDALLLTPPAPRTASLLSTTKWECEHLLPIREAVGAVDFRTVRSLVLHYPFELDRPFYGLVNADGEHDVGWCSREECKRGHVPGGESLLVVQMAPDWSAEHFDDPADEAADAAADAVAELLDDDRLREPDWTDDSRWRHAQPNGAAATEVLRRGEREGLFFAGDWVVGEGRIHEAFWNGADVAGRIREWL